MKSKLFFILVISSFLIAGCNSKKKEEGNKKTDKTAKVNKKDAKKDAKKNTKKDAKKTPKKT